MGGLEAGAVAMVKPKQKTLYCCILSYMHVISTIYIKGFLAVEGPTRAVLGHLCIVAPLPNPAALISHWADINPMLVWVNELSRAKSSTCMTL